MRWLSCRPLQREGRMWKPEEQRIGGECKIPEHRSCHPPLGDPVVLQAVVDEDYHAKPRAVCFH